MEASVIQFGGRLQSKPNADLNGSYFLAGYHCRRPAYQKSGSIMTLYHSKTANRWVLDRKGITDSQTSVAFAEGDAETPICRNLKWHVWNPVAKCHEVDNEVELCAAPRSLLFTCPYRSMHGEYFFHRSMHGYPSYLHEAGRLTLHCDGKTWMIAQCGSMRSGECSAYAHICGSSPWDERLSWHFYDPEQQLWREEKRSCFRCAPPVCKVFGLPAGNGSYRSVGLQSDRPVYALLPDADFTLRYCASSDRWVIMHEQHPGILRRVVHWMAKAQASQEVCIAFAAAHGATDPSSPSLHWRWQAVQPDLQESGILVTSAPSTMVVSGRRAKENSDINGEYDLIGALASRPMFRKRGHSMVIRYHREFKRWVIERNGLSDRNTCVAYAAALDDHADPSEVLGAWNVYCQHRGTHFADVSLSVRPSCLRALKRVANCTDADVPDPNAKRSRGGA